MKRAALIFVLTLSSSQFTFANTGKEFTTSVIYGALAGTLVGAATLAFTSSPGDNLNNVARGASYGLYAGILLGIYVTYGVNDNPNETGTEKPAEGTQPPPAPTDQENPNGDQGAPPQGQYFRGPSIFPVFEKDKLGQTKLALGANLLEFHF